MITICDISHFDLEHTFDCGQCFRWRRVDAHTYAGVAHGCAVKAAVEGNSLILTGVDEPNRELWLEYLGLTLDYGAVKQRLAADETLVKCMEFGGGIRILRQEPWETLVSFIISANNNIPRIMGIIDRLCENFGGKIMLHNEAYYTFPSPQTLAKLQREDLAPIRAGFRDKYILDAASKAASGEIDLAALSTLPTDEARRELMKIKGVGKKVADCVLLFAYGRYEVFPQDVWTKRILANVYGAEGGFDRFTYDKFGELAGIAQQYLFNFYRKKEKENVSNR